MSEEHDNDKNHLTIGRTFRYDTPLEDCFGDGIDKAFHGVIEERDDGARVERHFLVKENGLLRVVEEFFVGGDSVGQRTKDYYLDAEQCIEATDEPVKDFARAYHLDDPEQDIEECYERQ